MSDHLETYGSANFVLFKDEFSYGWWKGKGNKKGYSIWKFVWFLDRISWP